MAILTTVFDSGSSQFLKYGANAGGALTALTLPTGVYATTVRPTFLQYKKTAYILGHYSANLVVNRYLQTYIAGIDAPVIAPVLVTSGTGITADSCYGYYTFVHKVGAKVIAESSPSPPSNSLVLVNQGRQWTNVPTTAPNTRVTHVRGYLVVNGGTGRMAWERQLGTATVTESIATLALAQVINFNRGVPPNAVFGELYHDRLWYVDRADRTRIWYSELFEPESVGPLSFFTTWDGEFITGIKRHGDVLLVFCRSCCYAVTGWETADLVMRKITPSIGCISHWAIVDINGRTWFPSMEGIYFYDGSFRHMMKDLSSYWRDAYLADSTNYENSIAADDRFWNGYKLLIPGSAITGSFYYFGHYKGVEPELEGSTDQPKWVWDRRSRFDFTIGLIRNLNSKRDELYTGSCDGVIRKENVAADATDDGDTYNKRLTIRFKHYLFDNPGGDIREGKQFYKLWTYVQAELNSWILSLFGGDEWEGDTAPTTPVWQETVPASQVGLDTSPMTVHTHRPEKISGRGLTTLVEADFAKDMSVRGFGGIHRTYGHAARGGPGTE